MAKESKTKYIISVLAAGILWGTMGFFTKKLAGFGIGSEAAVIVRCGFAALFFFVFMIITGPKQFRIKSKDFWCFLGSGICSLLFFTVFYFKAINIVGLSVAAILLYTAPAIVMILSAPLFGEKITKKKLIALIITFLGCVLVSGIGTDISIPGKGLLFGLLSGLGYALYTIFARFALNRGYSSTTINAYSSLFAAIGAAIVFRPASLLDILFTNKQAFLWGMLMAFITCFLAYALYTFGLTGLENGLASIIASVEPIVAGIIGVLVFNEKMSMQTALGIAFVLAAIALINSKSGKKFSLKDSKGKSRIIMMLICNILVALSAGYGIILHLDYYGISMLKFYTVLSNILLCLTSANIAILCIMDLTGIIKKIPAAAMKFKYYAVCTTNITFLIVLFVLAPSMGYKVAMLGDLFYNHTFAPLLGFISLILFEAVSGSAVKTAIRATYFTFIYGAVMLLLNILKKTDGPYPFLRVYNQPVSATILWAIGILGGAFLVSLLTYKLCRRK